VREIRQSGLHEEKRTADINIVQPRELVHLAVFQTGFRCHTGVVDDDVDLQGAGFGVGKVGFRDGDDMRRAGLGS
jgi:hypothetical protein